MADWAIGVIYAVHLKRDGASYQAEAERFCAGAPLNVTDLAVGPDGALYFTLGGRGTQGGVYRIVYPGRATAPPAELQPLAAWHRAALASQMDPRQGGPLAVALRQQLEQGAIPSTLGRVRALTLLQMHGRAPDARLLTRLAEGDKDAEVRAAAIWLLGVQGPGAGKEVLVKALRDDDALVRRRACEAWIRAGMEPPVNALWPLLGDQDRFVRTAARLVLERIDPQKWAERSAKESNNGIAWQGIIALCKTHQASPYAEPLFARLRGMPGLQEPVAALLDYLRTVQMALIHVRTRPIWVSAIAQQ